MWHLSFNKNFWRDLRKTLFLYFPLSASREAHAHAWFNRLYPQIDLSEEHPPFCLFMETLCSGFNKILFYLYSHLANYIRSRSLSLNLELPSVKIRFNSEPILQKLLNTLIFIIRSFIDAMLDHWQVLSYTWILLIRTPSKIGIIQIEAWSWSYQTLFFFVFKFSLLSLSVCNKWKKLYLQWNGQA